MTFSPQENPGAPRTFTYDYDLAAGTFDRTGPDGVVTHIETDPAGRVTLIRRGPEADPLMTASYTYFDNGLVDTVTYGNGAHTDYTYDDANRVTVIDHWTTNVLLFHLAYTYDERGLPTRIDQEDQVFLEDVYIEYGYDALGRLISERRADTEGIPSYDIAYLYDRGGNRTKRIDNLTGAEVHYHYDIEDPGTYGSANNRLMYYETFDSLGALASTTYYYYNDRGNPTRIVTETPDAGGGTMKHYTATRLGYARNKQAVTYAVGETWDWDPSADPPQACPSAYNITYAQEYRYDSARARYLKRSLDPAELLQGNFVSLGDTWTDYDGSTAYGDFTLDTERNETYERWYQPGIAMGSDVTDPAATAYYHTDLIGTTRVMSDATGAAVSQFEYTAFGVPYPLEGGGDQRYGYAGAWGYQSDAAPGPAPSTGAMPFLHVGARYYDPTTGRFLQRDPIGILFGANVYDFVYNVPTVLVDPAGLGPFPNLKLIQAIVDAVSQATAKSATSNLKTGCKIAKKAASAAMKGVPNAATSAASAATGVIDTAAKALEGGPGVVRVWMACGTRAQALQQEDADAALDYLTAHRGNIQAGDGN